MHSNSPTTGSLVWHLAMRWRNEVDRAVRPLGLTHAQYSALVSLHSLTKQNATPSQKALADYTGLQPIYISRLVRTLEGDGYVSREVSSDDSRAVALTLTESGRETALEARRIVRALDRRLTLPLGGPEAERTRDLASGLRLLLNSSEPPAN